MFPPQMRNYLRELDNSEKMGTSKVPSLCQSRMSNPLGQVLFWLSNPQGIPTTLPLGKNTDRCISNNLLTKINWATSWENLVMPYANNKDADQHEHPRSLVSISVVRCLDSIMSLVSISEILKTLASHYNWDGWFEAFLVQCNPQDRFFHRKTGFLMTCQTQLLFIPSFNFVLQDTQFMKRRRRGSKNHDGPQNWSHWQNNILVEALQF